MRSRILIRLGLVFMFCFIIIGAELLAQEAPSEQVKTRSWFELLIESSSIVYILFALSIIGTALAIQYWISIRQDRLAPPQLLVRLEENISEGNIDDAMATCEAAGDTYLGRVMMGALMRIESGIEEMQRGLDETAQAETFKINAKISNLSLIGSISPLLGLLGTVTGMISSFQVIEGTKAPTPAQLASGVYEALVSTTVGLVLAVVFLSLYFFLRNRVSNITLALNNTASELLSHISTMISEKGK
jgi:biopolymer transport protein ExbB